MPQLGVRHGQPAVQLGPDISLTAVLDCDHCVIVHDEDKYVLDPELQRFFIVLFGVVRAALILRWNDIRLTKVGRDVPRRLSRVNYACVPSEVLCPASLAFSALETQGTNGHHIDQTWVVHGLNRILNR
ncbi:hypothetical protein GQ600_137 [Phytophthora cactorum]|nr:hypothetical protein GQ600_137 [Phytophthora cactorum]